MAEGGGAGGWTGSGTEGITPATPPAGPGPAEASVPAPAASGRPHSAVTVPDMTDVALSPAPARTDPDTKTIPRLLQGIALLLAVGVCIGIGGFLNFVDRAATARPPADARAEGIVVLTGGPRRIDAGLDLLDRGGGTRLLISGVHPVVPAGSVARQTDRPDLFSCCVDLDRQAANTVSNADEARKWADIKGYRSLVVVTGAQHMPRSMLEFSRALPGRALIAYPVAEQDLSHWYLSPRLAKRLAIEYAKYLVVRLRQSALTPVRSPLARAEGLAGISPVRTGSLSAGSLSPDPSCASSARCCSRSPSMAS